MLLVRAEWSWSDEIGFEGWELYTEEEWEKYQKDVRNLKYWPKNQYIGTNESQVWDNVDQFLSHFKVEEISDSDAEVIKRLFGYSGGIIPEVYLDEDDEDELFWINHNVA